MQNRTLEAALIYAEKFGFTVIPVRPDKKPFIPWADYQKRPATSDEIRGWWQKYPNAMIGLVTGEVSGIFIIDCDTQEGYEAIQKLLPDSLVIPIARTPRGGWHLYFLMPKDFKLTIGAGVLPGVDFRGAGGYIIAPPSVNGTGKAYVWQDNLSLDEVAPAPLPDAIVIILNNSYIYKEQFSESYRPYKTLHNITDPYKMFEYGRRDNDLFHTANILVKGGMPENEITQVLERLIISWGENSDPKWINAKIESALKRADKRERNLKQEILEWVTLQEGYWNLTELNKTLQNLTKEEKTNLHVIIHRLKKDGIIEKYGNQAGVYRRVDNECEEIDFLNASVDTVDIHWPFGIEGYVKTLPKNIIVIAGEPNAGKTAFLLNVVALNQDRHRINYFSSEMGSIELRDRLSKFDMSLSQWKFLAKERSSNFADVIRPDEINIIDFLEIHEDFWKVGGFIKEIYDKLSKGIAIIALQKNKGSDYGLGGMRGLEKARLYLSMEPGKISIVKAKNWASQENPNGLRIDFKLAAGCKFKNEGPWKKG